MPDMPEALKFRVLMCFLVSDPLNCTVTGISRTLKEEKYTISRTMIRLEQEGLLDRSDPRCPQLTEKGRTAAERYRDRISLAQNHLLYEGVDMEHARQDARVWALYCSDAMMDTIRSSDELYRAKHELRSRDTFSGAVLCKKLKDGSYPFPFIIYREQVKDNNNISMANNGFEHPCTLLVRNGVGVIRLRVLPLSRRSERDGTMLDGKVSKLEYLEAGRFVSAEFHGDVVSFPAAALTFINMGAGVGQILHGSVCVNMQASCGPAMMPESKALFTILI